MGRFGWVLLMAMAVGLTGGTVMAEGVKGKTATAVLGGGCFWCLEHDLQNMDGVLEAVSGYAGGSRANPTYQNYHDVDAANPVPHIEVVKVTYDPDKLSYEKLLAYYFRHIDATDGGGQFADRGPGYRPVIFAADKAEKTMAEAEKRKAEEELGAKVAVEILPDAPFWPAEEYHQDYADKNPLRYKLFRMGSGRDAKVDELWGKTKK